MERNILVMNREAKIKWLEKWIDENTFPYRRRDLIDLLEDYDKVIFPDISKDAVPEKMYTITYINTDTGKRESYMELTAFTEKQANNEIELLEKQQEEYEYRKIGRTRKDFKKEFVYIKTDM
jgi:hypothetical protein